MKFLKLVTVTGPDDTTDIDKLLALAEEFPYVEFGILLSQRQMGNRRFPSTEWLNKLVDAVDGKNLNISGHLCGSWVRSVLIGKWPHAELNAINPRLQTIFKRWQINTHGLPHKTNAAELVMLVRERYALDQSIIFQFDNPACRPLHICMEAGCTNIATLFDLSHGAGVLPESWPAPIPGVLCGYAGGLSPENVEDQLNKIQSVIKETPIWIDAETHLRSPDNTIFDLARVRSFLIKSVPFML